jgi:serine O-acetyltransferase
MNRIKRIIINALLDFPRFWVRLLYGNIWNFRNKIKKKRTFDDRTPSSYRWSGWRVRLYNAYWSSYGGFIGVDAVLDSIPIFPHGAHGVFISNSAHIGSKCVIFQQVTIGSNTIKDSKNQGAPYLEDGVYIGCGAKIIGNVHVGRNARIGANCVVVKDVPPNSVTVIRGIETIEKDYELDNEYLKNQNILIESLGND